MIPRNLRLLLLILTFGITSWVSFEAVANEVPLDEISAQDDTVEFVDALQPEGSENEEQKEDEDGDKFATVETYLKDPLEPIRTTWKLQPIIPVEDFIPKHPQLLQELVGQSSPANFVLLFLSNSDACRTLFSTIDSLARLYWSELEKRRSVSTSKLYFLSVNASRPLGAKIFREFRIMKVPTVVIIPKGGSLPSPGDSFSEDLIMDPSFVEMDEITSWAEQHIESLKLPRLSSADIMGGTANFIERWGVLIIFIQVMIILLSNAPKFTRKSAWLVLSTIVYFISSSGCIYSILRGAPPFGFSNGGFMFIYPDRGGQFFFEGLLIGLFNLCISLCFTLAAYSVQGEDVLTKIEAWLDGAEQPPRGRKLHPDAYQKLYKTASLCIAVGIIFALNLWVVFKRKAPWYAPFGW